MDGAWLPDTPAAPTVCLLFPSGRVRARARAGLPGYAVPALSELTPLQRRAFELLEAEPHPAPA